MSVSCSPCPPLLSTRQALTRRNPQNPVKGERYLALLDDARCEGRWDAVPELVRKVRKHAPSRSCLATTAETECAITKEQDKQTSRPTTALPENAAITEQLQKLQSALAGESTHLEDRFQAQVCIGWTYWALSDYSTAAAQLHEGSDQGYSQFESSETATSEWTKFWAELFLTEYCMLHAQSLEQGEKTLEDPNSLAPFRTWATYWDTSRTPTTSVTGGQGFRDAVPRRRVWYEYYGAISAILRQDLPFPTGFVDKAPDDEASAKNQLRTELKKVEAAYEALLLTETTFPRADEEREEVELFVQTVMVNWTILGGRDWDEHDLGHGGKEGLSRGVLDILYRAATKTFHSTAILRHLFTVHLAVADFDLAFKALDSYLEIVKKGKARVDKTGHPEPSLDDDATVLETLSRAITALCKYGFADEAEKARKLGEELEEMLEKLPGPLPKLDEQIPTLTEETEDSEPLHPRIPAHVNALAWQAIGLSQAQWSRKTYSAVVRAEAQEKAIRCFQKSLSPETGNPTDVRTLFALGLLLAEQRKLSAAIDFVKAALMSNKKAGDQGSPSDAYWRERSLIPLWHLLALLLSARQEYVMAARACEGAFEQFDDPTVLFGSENLDGGAYRSEHLNEVEGNAKTHGLVDDMDDIEKEGIVEIKMTQLALLELLEGPEVAVNASHELLVLYTRLFGSMQPSLPSAERRNSVSGPKSADEKVQTRRASIFSTKSRTARRASVAEGETSRPQTAGSAIAAAQPTIQVTKENGDSSDWKSSGSVRSRHRSGSTKRGNSLRKKRESTGSVQRSTSNSEPPVPKMPSVLDGDAYFTPLGETPAGERPDFFSWSSKNHISSSQSLSAGRGLQRYDSTTSAKASTVGEEAVILESLSAPNTLPAIHFPKAQVDRQRLGCLIKVWLMIAGFYRRADMWQDSHGALEEAKKLVDSLQAEIAKDTTNAISLTHPGWGGKKSVEELWSDVRSEMAYLFVGEGAPYKARAQFEEALMHYPNHPAAIVGLSNILLDIYGQKLLPTPTIPEMTLPDGEPANLNSGDMTPRCFPIATCQRFRPLRWDSAAITPGAGPVTDHRHASPSMIEELPAPYKAVSLPLVDRLAARDRAYGLLTTLTKLGTGWNYSDAWFALARAHEESGQVDKAKEALWWCVELEEGMGVREWTCVGIGGYVL
ncbi:cargo-transport ypp1 [Apiospora hydei]|uniref:Cargo-transport ypp1 n=1 Tax=Apiospora hydei TaxID=1337664 RepID=A0ABR1X9C7_9PEZI